MTRSLVFGSKTIRYKVEYSARKTLGIYVLPDTHVVARAPLTSDEGLIEARLRKRAPWILKQIRYFLGFFPKQPPKRYLSGESHLYRGRQYKLKVVQSKTSSVRISGSSLIVRKKKTDNVRGLLTSWYKSEAGILFPTLVRKWSKKFDSFGVEPSGLVIKSMSKRWGSCTIAKRIILNTELIQAPKSCVEYVIVHELCHLVHRNHSSAFFKLHQKLMPDWSERKVMLERLLG